MNRRGFLRTVYHGALAAGYLSVFGLPGGGVAKAAGPAEGQLATYYLGYFEGRPGVSEQTIPVGRQQWFRQSSLPKGWRVVLEKQLPAKPMGTAREGKL